MGAGATTLVSSQFEARGYHCHRRGLTSPCSARAAVSESVVEPYIEALFWQELEAATKTPSAKRLRRLEETIERRDAELAAYRDNPSIITLIGADRFESGLAVRMRRLEKATAELSRARIRDRPVDLPALADLRDRWSSMSVDERRAAIGEIIEAAFLSPGDASIEERLFVCLRGQAPADLPVRHTHYRSETRPFDPASCPPGVRLRREAPDLTESELRARLEPFLRGRERWPPFREFQAAGLAWLYDQVQRHGGRTHVAELVGLPFHAGPNQTIAGWSEERIREELRIYLAAQSTWPGRKQFLADGREGLRNAVNWFGGPDRWARELQVELPPKRRPHQRWPYARTKSQLAAFTAARTRWPAKIEFDNAGKRALYEAIRRRGLRDQLAAELDLQLPPASMPPKRRWTDAAIEHALDDLLKGRTSWPTYREFEQAGLGGLNNILQFTGRRDAWASRYGFRPQQRGRDRPSATRM